MKRQQTPEPTADANPAAMLTELEMLGRRAHDIGEQLRELLEYARQHRDLNLILKLSRCANAAQRASEAMSSDDLHSTVCAAAIYQPLPKFGSGSKNST